MRAEDVNLSERKLIDRNYIDEPVEVTVYHQQEVPQQLRDNMSGLNHSSLEKENVESVPAVVSKDQTVDNFQPNIQVAINKKPAISSNLQAINGDHLSELDIQSSHAALESENAASSTNLIVEREAPETRVFAVVGDVRKFNGKDDSSDYQVTPSQTDSRTRETYAPARSGIIQPISDENSEI